MSKLAGQWIDLFRAGDYSDVGKGTYTEQDLDQIVKNYDPAHHEAPSTIGHIKPNDKAPAYGWWSELRRVGGLLQGKMGTVQPEFEEQVERKLYKKRSVGLVKRAGQLALHHVAWLGAQPPQIKGLADVAFEQEEADVTEIDFSEESSMTKEELKEFADSLVGRLQGLFTPKTDETPKVFSEADVNAKIEALKVDLAKQFEGLTTQFSERETKLATAETATAASTAIERVKAAKAWVPAFDKAGVPALFAELAKATETIDFGEGADKVTKSKVQAFADFLMSFGEIVPASRVVDKQRAAAPDLANLPKNADPNSIKFNELSKARAAEKSITFGEAMDQIATEHPELTRPGDATAGQA